MSEQLSFIEAQFPVSKVSKESYKERKASNAQTLTTFGKWWGRKPLVVVSSAIIGCLMPAGSNPKKDTEIFLRIMGMDKTGLLLRKNKKISISDQYNEVQKNSRLKRKYGNYFYFDSGKPKLDVNAPKDEIETEIFNTFGYDKKLSYCVRQEQLTGLDDDSWNEINNYLGTTAHSIQELVTQLSKRKFGHTVNVGDCFCGGGSIPFEAARIGCITYGSDLNPIAGLLTWSDIHLSMLSDQEIETLDNLQDGIFESFSRKMKSLDVEDGCDTAKDIAYLYCVEVKCPECGTRVPLAPSWVIGKGTKAIVILEPAEGYFNFKIKVNASAREMKEAEKGTVTSSGIVCPHCGKTTPISSIRHDMVDDDGNTIYGLRLWNKTEFEPREEDVYHERLYAIKIEDTNGKKSYRSPNEKDRLHEDRIHDIVEKNFKEWQKNGFIPSMEIEDGDETSRLFRERGWKYWHQLFNARQILELKLYIESIIENCNTPEEYAVSILNLNKFLNFNSKLCRWRSNADAEHNTDTFYNQALNTMVNYGVRPVRDLRQTCHTKLNRYLAKSTDAKVELSDARNIEVSSDIFITDPPYGDAVNYHELSEYFLAWDKPLIQKAFPDWYTDSKRILAVKGDEHFSQTMIEIYSNLTKHMPDNGMQVVMFTHSDPAVWAQLAIIMWRAGLKVTAAWNIATETDASGLKNGNYVKGTVLLILRKKTGTETAFLDEINVDIRSEVKRQIASMQELDDKEEPNFSDPDYVLAAYAASLKVLTAYAEIEDLDLDYELNQAVSNPSGSKIVSIIENAKKVAYDCVIPLEFNSFLWRELTNAEKFYIKGLESEKHSNYQISTYQEFARGFSIAGYSQLMASERANTARLKTPFEMAGRTMNDVPDFENSLMRSVFHAIYAGVKEDMNPNKALGFLRNDVQNYWEKREMIKQILTILIDIRDITNMQPHWTESAEMAEQLLAIVTHDSI